MQYLTINQLLKRGEAGKNVTVQGWVKSKRISKNFAFIVVNDGSQQRDLQLIIDDKNPQFKNLDRVTTGCCIKASGIFKESPGKGQQWEVEIGQLSILGECDPEKYPLQKKGHTLEFLRDISHLRPRTNTFGAVFRVRHVVCQAVHNFFQENNFIWIHTPIITGSDCEGAGEMFNVTSFKLDELMKPGAKKFDVKEDFFGKPAHLTVSGQLQAEALALALGRVYTFGPTFRAENSNTTRHLAEFWMIEPEMAFTDLSGDADLAEAFLKHICKDLLVQCPEELLFFETMYKNIKVDEIAKLSEQTFHRMNYTDAISELKKAPVTFEFPVEWGMDLQSEHEKYLTDQVFKAPVIVMNYPKDIKAFYMRLNDDGQTVAAMDVLAPRIGEIIGGSQREDRYDVLKQRLEASGISPDELWWYLELRKYGCCPHAGFGLGLERLILYLTGMANIRDVIPFPRAPGLISF